MIRFQIMGRPRTKARPRTDFKRQRVYRDDSTKAREHDIGWLFGQAAGPGFTQITGPVKLTLWAIFEHPVKPSKAWPAERIARARDCAEWHTHAPDLDNLAKLVKDALNGVAWGDDGQVAMVCMAKRYGSPARTEVTVERL